MKTNKDKWPKGFSVTVGSKWTHREMEAMTGELYAADVDENRVCLDVTKVHRKTSLRLAWEGTAQELQDGWLPLPNTKLRQPNQ